MINSQREEQLSLIENREAKAFDGKENQNTNREVLDEPQRKEYS